jgi:hypothetical protein
MAGSVPGSLGLVSGSKAQGRYRRFSETSVRIPNFYPGSESATKN